MLKTKSLRPTQSEFSKLGVIKSMEKYGGTSTKPLIISMDGYVIDGHHRWLAAANVGAKLIPAIEIEMPRQDLIDALNNFKQSSI